MRETTPQLEATGFNVLLLDIHATPGRDLLERFKFVSTPTFLVFDASGQEVHRTATLPTLTELAAYLQAP